MFEKYRKPGRAKSIFASVIFGAICLVFVFFGITPDRGGSGTTGGAAATVDDAVISMADYRQAVQRMQSQYGASFDNMPEAQREFFEKTIRSRALEQLIMFELIAKKANREGVKIADAEIRNQIINIPAFQENGHFKRELYEQVLEANHLPVHSFEDKIRKELMLNRMEQIFMSALKSIPVEEEQEQRAKNMKLNLGVATFDRKTAIEKMPISAAEVNEYLSQDSNREKVKKAYEDNQQRFTRPEEVMASHILIKSEGDKGAEAALKKIQEIARETTPQNFAAQAKKYSQDEGSKVKGGDLGWFGRNRMVKEFETTAFTQAVGKVSEPVKSDFGYHLILVRDRHEASTSSLEQVQAQLAKEQIAETRVESWMDELKKKLEAGSKEAVTKALNELGIKIEETGETALNQEYWPKLGESGPAVLDAVARVRAKAGLVPELVQSQGRYYVVDIKTIRRDDKAKASSASLGEYGRDQMAARRANEMFENWYKNEVKNAKVVRNSQIMTQ